jgi:hypothetical protein
MGTRGSGDAMAACTLGLQGYLTIKLAPGTCYAALISHHHQLRVHLTSHRSTLTSEAHQTNPRSLPKVTTLRLPLQFIRQCIHELLQLCIIFGPTFGQSHARPLTYPAE